MSGTAAQNPSGKKPTPRERFNQWTRGRVFSVIGALGLLVLAVVGFSGRLLKQGNQLMEQWDQYQARQHPKTYDVAIYLSIQGYDYETGLPVFWRVDDMNGNGPQSYCPVPFLLNLSITNLMSDPMTISSYEVSVKRPDRTWSQLPRITLRDYQHLYSSLGRGLNNAAEFTVDPAPLDQQLTPTATWLPHKPLVGTVFFEDPSNGQIEGGDFQVTIRDALGHVFTSPSLRADSRGVFHTAQTFGYVPPLDLTDLMKHPYREHCD
jgi:hypothetical protein